MPRIPLKPRHASTRHPEEARAGPLAGDGWWPAHASKLQAAERNPRRQRRPIRSLGPQRPRGEHLLAPPIVDIAYFHTGHPRTAHLRLNIIPSGFAVAWLRTYRVILVGMQLPVFTLGHSTRTMEHFLVLLVEHGVDVLADVRRFPGSRRHPHFRRENLSAALREVGIAYRHLPGLGGRRKPRSDSLHTHWRNAGFRAYADYMDTADFDVAFAGLLELASQRRTAVMCAEAVPWRCHRQLLADALVARGFRVVHVLAPGQSEDHVLNPSARVHPDGRLIYDGGAGRQAELFD